MLIVNIWLTSDFGTFPRFVTFLLCFSFANLIFCFAAIVQYHHRADVIIQRCQYTKYLLQSWHVKIPNGNGNDFKRMTSLDSRRVKGSTLRGYSISRINIRIIPWFIYQSINNTIKINTNKWTSLVSGSGSVPICMWTWLQDAGNWGLHLRPWYIIGLDYDVQHIFTILLAHLSDKRSRCENVHCHYCNISALASEKTTDSRGGYRGGDEGNASPPPAYSNFLQVKNIANIWASVYSRNSLRRV